MQNRCTSKAFHAYKRYGGRGIKVEWASFEEFRDDMYESFLFHVKKHGLKNTTLERIDHNGNYSKKNCRWATWKEQQRNKSDNRLLTHNGKTMTIVEWSERTGIDHRNIWKRIFFRGWSVHDALTIPVGSLGRGKAAQALRQKPQ